MLNIHIPEKEERIDRYCHINKLKDVLPDYSGSSNGAQDYKWCDFVIIIECGEDILSQIIT